MSAEWRTLTLGQVGRVVTGKTPKTSDPDNFGGKIPFVTPTDMDGCKVMATTARYLSELGASTVKSSIIPAGSVMVSCIGSDMGKSVIAKHRCVTNQQINSVVVDAKFSSEFVYYNLSMRKAELQHLASGGSTMPILNKGIFSEVKIELPPLAEQLQIAETLSALDDRITLLRETNATLEAIAQALFKSWFVDFDPVRAKIEGRAPEGMDEATATLFPDSFEESELGLVPRGWPVGRLDDLLVLQRGFDLPSQDRTPGDFPIIAASGPSGTHHEAMVKGPGVVTGRSGVLGKVFLELKNFWPLNTTLWVKDFRVATPCYAYEVLRLLDFKSFNAGSAVPSLNRNHIHGLPYLLPDRRCVELFESIALTLHQRSGENATQAQTLATLRDTLLPRLISGQLRLPETQAVAEEALA